MPAVVKKTNKDKKTSKPVTSQSLTNITVKECLHWPDNQTNKKSAKTDADVVYVSLRAQRESHDNEKGSPERMAQPPPLPPRDDGTVLDALRGWPRHRQQNGDETNEQDTQTTQRADDEFLFTDSPPPVEGKKKPPQSKLGSKTRATASKGGKGAKRTVIQEPNDTTMGDIMSQKYRNEFIAQREAELEKERKKKEASERAARDGRKAVKGRTDLKANKAAQLRAIALADPVDSSPMDLWKMEKFTKTAKPHLSTFRNGAGVGAGSGRTGSGGSRPGGHGKNGKGGRRAGGMNGSDDDYDDELEEFSGPCTCHTHIPYYGEGGHDLSQDDYCRTPASVNSNHVNFAASVISPLQSPEPLAAL